MGAEFTAEEIMEITGARLALGMMPDEAAPIYKDTRVMPEGAWFIALPGQEFDGHDFLGDAFSQGAIGCIVAERPSYAIASTSFPLLAVDDTENALAALARNWRRRINPRVIVVIVNRSNEVDQVAQICVRRLASKYITEHRQFVADSLPVVLNAVLNLADDTRVLVLELSPTSFHYLEISLQALVPNVLIFSEHCLENLRLSLSQADFERGLDTCVEGIDSKKTKVILANADPVVEAAVSLFQGAKTVASNEVQPEQDRQEWAAQIAVKQMF